jgi:hypothetical protein
MEAEPPRETLKQRLRRLLNRQELTDFALLHDEFRAAVQIGAKNGDPLAIRRDIELMVTRMQGHALDRAIWQNHVLAVVERALAELEQRIEAATLEQRLAETERAIDEHRHARDQALQTYQRTANTLIMTVDSALTHYHQLQAPHDALEHHAAEVKRAKLTRAVQRLQRDNLAAERRMVALQRVREGRAMEKHLALVEYLRYFADTYTESVMARVMRRRTERAQERKEARDEPPPRERKKRRSDAHELVSESLCLFRQDRDHMVKFIAPDDALLRLYERLGAVDSPTAGGFMPVRRVERLDAEQVADWDACPDLQAQQAGAILLETDALQPLFTDEASSATRHSERFAVLYELVYFMQMAALLLDGFQYGQSDPRRLMWLPRQAPRRYGSLVCPAKMGVLMVDLTQARTGSGSLYLETTDYALFTALARALTVPNLTHKLLAHLEQHQRLPYTDLLRTLATYWSERSFSTATA